MTAEGVIPCIHQRIGTWIESPAELEAVLANVDPSVLLSGPDTGHLAWSGSDPAEVIGRHLNRVGGVHLKDFRSNIGHVNRRRLDYAASTANHVWAEPGRGDVDFDAILNVVSAHTGWYVIEIDIGDEPTRPTPHGCPHDGWPNT